MRIDQPPADTRWVVTHSWLLDHPESINTDDLGELRNRIQAMADKAKVTTGGKGFGRISYRYECDKRDYVTVVHAYFIDRKGLNKRFMKLRRD